MKKLKNESQFLNFIDKHYTDYFIEPFCLDRLHKISNSTSLGPRLEEKKELNHWDYKRKDQGNFFYS